MLEQWRNEAARIVDLCSQHYSLTNGVALTPKHWKRNAVGELRRLASSLGYRALAKARLARSIAEAKDKHLNSQTRMKLRVACGLKCSHRQYPL